MLNVIHMKQARNHRNNHRQATEIVPAVTVSSSPVEVIEAEVIREVAPLRSDLSTYVAEYLNHLSHRMPNTREDYAKYLRAFMAWLRTYTLTSDSPRQIVEDFNAYICNYVNPMTGKQYSSATVQAYTGTARRFVNWLGIIGKVPTVNLSEINTPTVSRDHKHDALTEAQATQLLRKAKEESLRDYALIKLLLTCGLRTIEINRATIGDLRQRGGVVCLDLQGKGHRDKDNYTRLTSSTELALREYLATRTDGNNPNAPLFVSRSGRTKGKPLTTAYIRGRVKTLLRSIGLDSAKLSAHSLRHTAVTFALKKTNNVQVVQQFARHARIDTTLIYAHNLERLNNNCCDLIEEAINEAEA